MLTDGRVLVVEFKGWHLADSPDTREKQMIGALWAEASEGACLFAMPEDSDLAGIDRAIKGST